MTLMSVPAGSVLSRREPAPFRFLIEVVSGRIIVRGDLDRSHAQQLAGAVDVLRFSPAPRWSIDAAGITFCDAGGLRCLLHANEMAVRYGRTLVVIRPSGLLAQLLALVGPEAPEVVQAGQEA